jgi:hypothetical protein
VDRSFLSSGSFQRAAPRASAWTHTAVYHTCTCVDPTRLASRPYLFYLGHSPQAAPTHAPIPLVLVAWRARRAAAVCGSTHHLDSSPGHHRRHVPRSSSRRPHQKPSAIAGRGGPSPGQTRSADKPLCYCTAARPLELLHSSITSSWSLLLPAVLQRENSAAAKLDDRSYMPLAALLRPLAVGATQAWRRCCHG